MTKQKLKNALNVWAQQNRKDAALRIAKMMLKRLGTTTPNLEKFSTWLLLSSGTASGLIISNLAALKLLTSSTGLRYCLYSLIISIIFGVISKCLSLVITNEQAIIHLFEEELSSNLEPYEKDSDEIDKISTENEIGIDTNINAVFEDAIKHYKEPFSILSKFLITSDFRKGKQDQIFAYKKIAKQVVLLGEVVFLQATFVIMSLIFVAYHIN